MSCVEEPSQSLAGIAVVQPCLFSIKEDLLIPRRVIWGRRCKEQQQRQQQLEGKGRSQQ